MEHLPTARLLVRRMTLGDAEFILRLLNEESWLRFIGDRGVRTVDDATKYIADGPLRMYETHGFGFCVVESGDTGVALGLCGLTQRDYLDSPDLGYAFLPEYHGQGYAFESAAAVLAHAQGPLGLRRVLATTRIDNLPSQRLLEKLGLRFERTIAHPDGDRMLKLYALAPNAQAAKARGAE